MRKLLAITALAFSVQAAAEEPALPGTEFVFQEIVKLSPAIEVGKTARGNRRIIPIIGGRVEGPQINGEVMPGGWDWQLDRADGCTDVVADYFIKTDDGVIINVVNKGALCPGQPVRTHPVMEAPIGKYDWLSKGAFVGTLELADPAEGPAVKIRIFKVK